MDGQTTKPMRKKLFEDIAEGLRLRILGGELRPGDKLPSERELMRVYEVGRPSVREALQTLERSGLIAINHGERARVVAPSSADVVGRIEESARHLIRTSSENLEHLKEARTFFEVGMARIAAQKATPGDVDALRHLVDAQARAEGDPAFLQADMRFHIRLAGVAGNPIYTATSEATFAWLTEYHIELVRVPGAEALTVKEHGRIVDAVAAGDREGAAMAMEAHLSRANALYRQFEAEGPAS
ncbi:MAG: transcriptional regulator NanR [Pseudomonadota bacterium]